MLSYLSFALWLAAGILVGYSYVSYQTNALAHGLFFTAFLALCRLGFVSDKFRQGKSWQKIAATLFKCGLILLAVVALSGEYHRLFGERLPLFD